jgi:hypothetical protein
LLKNKMFKEKPDEAESSDNRKGENNSFGVKDLKKKVSAQPSQFQEQVKDSQVNVEQDKSTTGASQAHPPNALTPITRSTDNFPLVPQKTSTLPSDMLKTGFPSASEAPKSPLPPSYTDSIHVQVLDQESSPGSQASNLIETENPRFFPASETTKYPENRTDHSPTLYQAPESESNPDPNDNEILQNSFPTDPSPSLYQDMDRVSGQAPKSKSNPDPYDNEILKKYVSSPFSDYHDFTPPSHESGSEQNNQSHPPSQESKSPDRTPTSDTPTPLFTLPPSSTSSQQPLHRPNTSNCQLCCTRHPIPAVLYIWNCHLESKPNETVKKID